MYELVQNLSSAGRVLDLGAASGSFDYSRTTAWIAALDLDVSPRECPNAGWIRGSALRLPFRDGAFDVVICNHTLEHFESLPEVLAEVGRVLKMGGCLWASVPAGSSLDNRLYRFLFRGGGHVNQFTLGLFLDTVEAHAGARALSLKNLYTGFVYLNPPTPERLKLFPRPTRLLRYVPPGLLRSAVRRLNQAVRFADRLFGTGWSRYGWAVCFRRTDTPSAGERDLEIVAEDVNVCFACGSGHPVEKLRSRVTRPLLSRSYRCEACGARNFFFEDA